MQRFTFKNLIVILFFIVLVFVLAQLFGCSSSNVSQSACDDIVGIFSLIGKTVCQTISNTTPTTASLMKSSGEFQQVVVGSDTVNYTFHVSNKGSIDITWKTTKGYNGYVQVERSNILRE